MQRLPLHRPVGAAAKLGDHYRRVWKIFLKPVKHHDHAAGRPREPHQGLRPQPPLNLHLLLTNMGSVLLRRLLENDVEVRRPNDCPVYIKYPFHLNLLLLL